MKPVDAYRWLDPSGMGFIRTRDGLCGFPHDDEDTLTSVDLRCPRARERLEKSWQRIAAREGLVLVDLDGAFDAVAVIAEDNGF